MPVPHRQLARQNAWKRANADKIRSQSQRDYDENISRHLVAGARSRAKARNLPFDLNRDDVIVPPICPVLGIPIRSSRRYATENSPTLDRIRNDLGYVRGNVQVISSRANRLKSDASVEELQLLIKYVNPPNWKDYA